MDIPWTEETIFDSYIVWEETYKLVSSYEIKTTILVPKDLKPGPHPLIYHVHGGFLTTGHGLFTPLFPKWMSKLALEHSAIIVSPDHRLLPSANGVADVLEDLEDGWQWTKSELPGILRGKSPGHTLEFSQTLLVGGSAGGYCAAQLALSHPTDFSALAMMYPLIDPKDRVFTDGPRPGDPSVLRISLEVLPSKDDTMVWIEKKREKPHFKDGFDRVPFTVSACHNGLFGSHIFDNQQLNKNEFFPLERLESGEKLPMKIWLAQGAEDSTTPIRGADKFVDLVRGRLPEVSLRYDVVAGQDHAFDFDEKTWDYFASEALEFVTVGWLDKA